MAVLSQTINPQLNTELRHIRSQGANVGDFAYGQDGNYYKWTGVVWEKQDSSGTGSGGGGFNFNWEQSRKDAFNELTPYYEQKLKDADYDVERAKRLIDEDYERGLRYTDEDYAREHGYRAEDFESALKALGLDFSEEKRDIRGALNRRGVLLGQIKPGDTSSAAPMSGYAQKFHLDPMQQRQEQRKLAVERAMQRQEDQVNVNRGRTEESLKTERTRGIEEQDIAYPRYKTALEEEKREKAFNVLTPMKYQEEYAKYQAANQIPS